MIHQTGLTCQSPTVFFEGISLRISTFQPITATDADIQISLCSSAGVKGIDSQFGQPGVISLLDKGGPVDHTAWSENNSRISDIIRQILGGMAATKILPLEEWK